MNARDRIAEALFLHDNPQSRQDSWPGKLHGYARDARRRQADAVLAVLPDLLTDPDVVNAAASELRRWEVEAVAGINYEATPSVTRQVLAAAVKALTGGNT